MKCFNCGKDIKTTDRFCSNCGLENMYFGSEFDYEYYQKSFNDSDSPYSERANDKEHLNANYQKQIYERDYKQSETLGWVAIFVGFFVMPLVAFICGGIGLSKARATNNKKGKLLCTIGIILGVVSMIISMFLMQYIDFDDFLL